MTKIKDIFKFHLWPIENEIGIEVELEGQGLKVAVNGWLTEGDGSLRNYGVEFILREPLSKKDAYIRLDGLYKSLKKNSILNISDRCAVHIHVNCQNMEIKQVFNYISLYLILEDLILSWCGEEREGNLFCLRAKDAEWLIYSLIGDKKNWGVFETVTNRNSFKYASINVASIRYYGSLEFRALPTPISAKPIKDYISLLLRIKRKALEVGDAKDFISECSARGEREWVKGILGPHFNMLKCMGMDEKIMAGVRRTQALIYTPLKKIKKPIENKNLYHGGVDLRNVNLEMPPSIVLGPIDGNRDEEAENVIRLLNIERERRGN